MWVLEMEDGIGGVAVEEVWDFIRFLEEVVICGERVSGDRGM